MNMSQNEGDIEKGNSTAPVQTQKERFKQTNALYLIIVSSKQTNLKNAENYPCDNIDSDAAYQNIKGMQQLFNTHNIDSVNHAIYFNTKSTSKKYDLENELSNLFQDEDANSVVIYYHGHGNELGEMCFNTKTDTFTYGLDDLLELWQYRSKNIKHLLLILESCFSGKWVEKLNQLKDKTISILSSCQANQMSEYKYGIGAFFTYQLQKTYIENIDHRDLDYIDVDFQPSSYSLDYSKLFYYYNLYVEKIDGWQTYTQIHQKLSTLVPQLIASTIRGPDEYIEQQSSFILDDNEEQQNLTGSVSIEGKISLLKRQCINKCNEFLQQLNISQRWSSYIDIYIGKKQYIKSKYSGYIIYIIDIFFKYNSTNQTDKQYQIVENLYLYWQQQVDEINRLTPNLKQKKGFH